MLSAEFNQKCINFPMLEHLEDSREAVAARLKRVREVLGLTKKDFAERAGLTEQTYGPFENAKRDLSLQAAKLLRRTYSLPLEFLYFGKIDDLPTRISKDL
ncbi:MAG: helix-turn-helix transcriptional regulator [Rhodobacterales bacterium]